MSIVRKIMIAIPILMLIACITYSQLQQSKVNHIVFTTIKGQTIRMTSLKGKVVLVNFWATDCKSCVKEMPDLIKTYYQYQPRGFEIIAVAMPYDPPAQVVNFATQKALPFPVIHDSYANITKSFGDVELTPTTYVYNKDGKRIQRAIGTINFNKLHALLEKELS